MDNIITYFGQTARIICDENCTKAWGISTRPKEQLSEDYDDVVWLSDDELGDAPADPGTYEGGYGKPTHKKEIPNKWCVRECERCAMSKHGELDKPLSLPDYSVRHYNQPWKHNNY